MKVVITCGHPESGYQSIHKMMVETGLIDANEQKNGHLPPKELHEKICSTYELDTQHFTDIEQITPGKYWEHAATDIFMSNLDNKHWGWADSNSAFLLDYWKEYEENTQFVLVYSSPTQALANAMKTLPATAESVENFTDSWSSINDAILKFYYHNQDRCILVNVNSLQLKNHDEFKQLTQSHLALDLNNAPHSELILRQETEYGDIAHLISESIQPENEDTRQLFQELEAVADFPGRQGQDNSLLKFSAWKNYANSISELNNYKNITECAILDREEAINKIEELKSQSKKVDDLEQENELILLQLHQVQKELRNYFVKYRELTNNLTKKQIKTTNPKRTYGTNNSLLIDFTKTISGENWHGPEHDGRWAGPGKVSTLQLPPVANGNYKLELDIVDSMSPEILKNIQIFLNGKALKTHRSNTSQSLLTQIKYLIKEQIRFPVLISSDVVITDPDIQNHLELRFPKVISPANTQGEDQRYLAIRVRSIALKAIT